MSDFFAVNAYHRAMSSECWSMISQSYICTSVMLLSHSLAKSILFLSAVSTPSLGQGTRLTAFSTLERSHRKQKILPKAGWVCGWMSENSCGRQWVAFLHSAPICLNLKQQSPYQQQQSHTMYPYQNNQPQNNNLLNNAPTFNKPHNNMNTYQPPQFANQPFLSPQGGFNPNRGVYASTIHASTSSSNLSRPGGMGLGKLESMGRMIKEEPDPISHRTQEAPSSFLTPPNNHFQVNNDRGKLASSVIFQKNYDEDINRFPGFNINSSGQTGTSKLDALFAKKQSNEVQTEVPNESAEERRKREITSIKQELELLNKRMENTVGKKNEGESKPYFQLPSRKSAAQTNNVPASNNAQQINKPSFQLNTPNTSNEPVQNSTEAPQINKAFFQNYSKNSNQVPTLKPTLNVQPQVQSKPIQQVQITNPVQLTNPVKTETGGMFKKKNPYAMEEQPKTIDQHAPKTFMLSPKGAVLSNGFKAEPIQAKTEIRAAEIIEPVLPKKTMKKTGSSQKLIPTSKVFKKSDFAIGKKMGKGQFGEVMLVQHKETGFLCGMKVMSKKQIREEKYVNQIARELSIQFYLNHRNVAPLYGYFQDSENVYLLIEYCTGGQLLQKLRVSHRMEEADTSPIIREICEGLDYIHKEEIIHRDIKPENILFNFNTVKICDFGWAVHCGSGMRKTVSGSPLYYSPEVVQETEYDQKVDIWAIGMMTYQCLIGKIPFRIYSELDLNRIVEDEVKFPQYIDVTDDAKDFILGIMQKNPDDRMVMKDIFKHPFVRKYLNQRKLAPEVLEEMRRAIN